MRFKDHSKLSGSHALLSPSSPAWLNYDEEKLYNVVSASLAARQGAELHALAANLIQLGVRLPESTATLNQYVNDCIGFRMKPEVTLFYSVNCYGTADAISFRNHLLRIFDLKTGITQAHFPQLRIYAALFCHDYGINPLDIEIELRIYQNDDVVVEEVDPLVIKQIMEHIVFSDHLIEARKQEVFG